MSPPSERERKRAVLPARLGSEVTVFQDAAYAVDEAAGAVLDLTRHELRCVWPIRPTRSRLAPRCE